MKEERLKELMKQCGMPNSVSVMHALQQAHMEGELAVRARTDVHIALLRSNIQEFCDKVDRGEAKSVKTYASFKDALAQTSQTDVSPEHSYRDWKEDSIHENGNYVCRCVKCHLLFYGYKRRVICRACV